MRIYQIVVCLIVFVSCQKQNKLEQEIAKISIETKVDRFDQIFAQAVAEDLPSLKKRYSYLFPKQYPDSVWVAQMQDTLQLELNKEVAEKFPDFSEERLELESVFQHMKYYFPKKPTPKIITKTSYVDYRNKVIYTDSLVLISLDTYLGKEHKFYEGIQEFISKKFEKEMIASDVVAAFAKNIIPFNGNRTFLSWMILYGKELYLKDALIPFKTDAQKIGYTNEELAWAMENESEVWRYFVERDLLFSTDADLRTRFIEPAPFSKFYLELDADSPGQLGHYIGWQIVRAYMDNNDVSLDELLYAKPDEIFNNSKFKPKK